MPRAPKEGKEPKKQRSQSSRERTDEELKNSPTFNKLFFTEVLKETADPGERELISNAYRDHSANHDDFSFKLFDLDWFLEKYENIFNNTKNIAKAPAPKEEPPMMVKQESYSSRMEYEEPDPNAYMRNQGMGGLKFEPTPQNYYSPYPQQTTGNIYSSMSSAYPTPTDQYQPQYGREKQAYPHVAPQQMNQMNQMQMQQMQGQMQGQMPGQMQGQMQGQMHPHMGQMPQQMMSQTQAQPPQMMSMSAPQMQQQIPQQMPQQMPAMMQTQPATPQTPAQQPTAARAAPQEKEEPTAGLIKNPLQTEFETNPQLRQRLSSIVPLNTNAMINFLAQKVGKKATDGFYQSLYLAVSDYTKNLLDELRVVCEMDSDAADFANYQKPSTGATQAGGQMEVEGQKNVLMGSETGTEVKSTKTSFLAKFSSLQEDQKQIDKLDERENKDLEDRYAMSKDEDEEKATKKGKKDFTEEDEIIKFLFKTKKDKSQDNENTTRKIKETNLFLERMTARSYSSTAASGMTDPLAQKQPGKGRKGGGGQKRVTMKHLIYYLETNPLYKRTPLLHKAYLK